MNNGTQHLLTIERMPQGGYLIWPFPDPSDFRQPIFACTTIGEALDFMRDMMTINRIQNSHEPPSHAKAIPGAVSTGWMKPKDVA